MTFYLSMRNLFLRRKRYTLIALAVMLGYTLITVLSGVSFGALETVKSKAARYFSGHITVTGYHGGAVVISEPDEIIEKIMKTGTYRTVAKRSIYYGREAKLFFGGNSIQQRRTIGIDFDAEKNELEKLHFIDGGIEEISSTEGSGKIIISEAAAKILGCRAGDDVVVYMATGKNQYNSATMIVSGIFRETSIFGYASYLRMDDLNSIYNRPEGFVTDIAVYAKEGSSLKKTAENIRLAIKEEFPVFPVIRNRSDLSKARGELPENETYAVISLDAQLAQIRNILDAFMAGTYFVLLVFMVIVMVGILNTYRVLVHERTKEIGTMRAIGMQRNQVKALFILEAGGLAVVSSAAGFVLGYLILKMIHLIDFSRFSASSMFTESGFLVPYMDIRIVLLNTLFMVLSVMIAAWGPARKASLMHPASALRKEG